MATNVSYGGILIKDVLVSSVSQETIFDESGVDPIYVRATVRISSSVMSDGSGFGVEATENESVPSSFVELKKRLTTPRQRFLMTVDGVTVFDVLPGAGALDDSGGNQQRAPGVVIDSNHGPRTTVESDEFIGNKLIHFTFAIDLAIPLCNNPPSGLIALRWRCSDDIDLSSGLTARTYAGYLRVAHKDINPHALARNLVFPPLPQHFKRQRIHFTEAPDGLTLHFFIGDVEQWTAVPKPASTWSGTQILSLEGSSEGKVATDIRIRLTGPRDVRKQQLVATGLLVIDGKLGGKLLTRNAANKEHRGLIDPSVRIEMLTIMDVLDHNTVEIALRASFKGDKDGNSSLVGFVGAGSIGDSGGGFLLYPNFAGYDPHAASYVNPTAGLSGIVLCALQSPCSPNTLRGSIAQPVPPENPTPPAAVPPENGETGNGELGEYGNAGTSILTNVTKTIGEIANSQSHADAVYLFYRMTSDLKQDTGRRVYAVAGTANATGDTAVAVKLHNGIATRTITIIAERNGLPAELPEPVDFTDANGIKHWLIDSDLGNTSPRPGVDGTPLHHQELTVRYKLSRLFDFRKDKILACQIPYWIPGSDEARGDLTKTNFKQPGPESGESAIVR